VTFAFDPHAVPRLETPRQAKRLLFSYFKYNGKSLQHLTENGCGKHGKSIAAIAISGDLHAANEALRDRFFGGTRKPIFTTDSAHNPPQHFVILSGDVHYSFANDIKARFQRSSPEGCLLLFTTNCASGQMMTKANKTLCC
jgi:hypothetical protein